MFTLVIKDLTSLMKLERPLNFTFLLLKFKVYFSLKYSNINSVMPSI